MGLRPGDGALRPRRAQTGTLRRLTNKRGYDAEASYSPDGQWIVFSSTRDAYDRQLSARRTEAARDRSRATSARSTSCARTPTAPACAVSPTSPATTAARSSRPTASASSGVASTRRGVIADVWTMNLDGTDQRQITDFGAMSWAPYIHPSGRYVLFASNKLGFENFELFLVDIDGTKEPIRVTYSDGFDGLPVPSPDGTRLAWTSSRGGGREGQIYLAQWNHQFALDALAAAPPEQKADPRICTMTMRSLGFATALLRAHRGAWPRRLGALSAGAGAGDRQLPRTRAYVETLASERFAGREAGSPGERQAGDYIAAQLARLGARPLPGRAGHVHVVRLHGRQPRRRLAARRSGHSGSPRPATWSRSPSPTMATVSAPVVFAGYGIVVPESQNFGYDSYATLDVKDKVVVVFSYFPEDADKETKSILARYSDLRYKALAARQRGAKALIVVTGPRSPNAGQTVPITFDTALAGSGIPAASISGKVAAALFGSRSLEVGAEGVR